MTLMIKMDQRLPIKVSFSDEDDNPVTGVPEWRISDDTIVMVELAPDRQSVWLFPVGPYGKARLVVDFDSFSGGFDIEIIEMTVWEMNPHKMPIIEEKQGDGKLRATFKIGPPHHSHDCA
jgi:hypothetical protein